MTALSSEVAFAGLFDDAAIFPPGELPLPDAVTAHRRHAGNPLVGPFVCSLARLAELDTMLDEPLDVAVVIPAGRFELPALRQVRIVAVERHADARGESPDVATYLELPTLPGTAADLAGIGRVKFRTGGLSAAAFPSEAALAAAISAAVEAEIPFKCTAGLHRAVRHTGADGFEHHGFVNVLLATSAALTGGVVEAILAERDGSVLAAWLRALPDDWMTRTRASFCSFGTCSIDEPLADLRTLGLLR